MLDLPSRWQWKPSLPRPASPCTCMCLCARQSQWHGFEMLGLPYQMKVLLPLPKPVLVCNCLLVMIFLVDLATAVVRLLTISDLPYPMDARCHHQAAQQLPPHTLLLPIVAERLEADACYTAARARARTVGWRHDSNSKLRFHLHRLDLGLGGIM
jgi:hypothetical protein